MKKFHLLILLLAPALAQAQVYYSKTSEVSFFSEAPVENIHAVNKSSIFVIRTSTNDIQARIPIINFKFEKKLMEEHFNENYMETEKYPNAEFKGKINETIDFTKNGEHNVSVTGKLTVHGVEKERTLNGKLLIKDGKIMLNTTFIIHIADHNIKIPSLYVKNIAEDVKVTASSTLEPLKK